AVWRTNASPGPGAGTSTSTSCISSGPPWPSIRIARAFIRPSSIGRSSHHGGAGKRIENAAARAIHVVADEGERPASVAALDGVDDPAVLGVEVVEIERVAAGDADVGEAVELVDHIAGHVGETSVATVHRQIGVEGTIVGD